MPEPDPEAGRRRRYKCINRAGKRKSPAEILTEATGGEGFDLTGCTPEEIQYTISHETPVVAMLSADHAVLVIGYTSEKYAYIDPADGERHSATPEEMAQMVSGSGNVFFGYVK